MQKAKYHNSDENLLYCPECNRVWELIRKKKGVQTEYYEEFPTYGKKKVVCSPCKVRIGIENVSLQKL